VSGGYDGGSSLSDNVAFAQKFGICRMKLWPRSKGWRQTPSDEAYADAEHYQDKEILYFPVSDTELLGTLLILGYPVYTGYSGHAWYAVWLLSTSQLIWMNSWGTGWGDNGMGTLAFSSLRYGCYAQLRSERSGLSYGPQHILAA
jgi:hypothetical protein